MLVSLVASLLFAQLFDINLPVKTDNFLLSPKEASRKEVISPINISQINQSLNWGNIFLVGSLTKEPVKVINNNIESLSPVVTATSAILIDDGSGKILWEKESSVARPIASITKLMTAAVFVEHNPGWEQKIRLKSAYDRDGGALKISSEESISLRDIFTAMLVGSLNNAAIALVDATGMSVDQYVEEMNKKAQDWGLEKTHFVEPTGLSPNNRSTARDLAKVLKAVINNPDIQTVISAKNHSIYLAEEERYYHISSTNQLLWSYLNTGDYQVVGAKTGYIEEAGYCFIVGIKGKKGQEIIGVVLNSANYDSRFQEMKGMFQWALDNYQW